jgi:acyl-CoA synthetase (AMP-forming)/AMP-acid ligase II
MSNIEKPWLKSYGPGISGEIEPPESSLPDYLEKAAQQAAELPAVHFLGMTLTRGDLNQLINRMANALGEIGLGKGDVVSICMPNTPQYFISLLGALKAGCWVSSVSPLLTGNEMIHQLNDCGAKAIVAENCLFEGKIAGITPELNKLKTIITTGLTDLVAESKQKKAEAPGRTSSGETLSLPGKRVLSFQGVLTNSPGTSPDIQVSLDDPSLIQYTGGTTGPSKGAVITHRNLIVNIIQFQTAYGFKAETDVFCTGLPMFHIGGLGVSLVALYTGMPQIIIPDPRDLDYFLKQIAKYKPTVCANVPTLYLMFLNEPLFHDIDWSNLKFFFSGAAPFTEDGINAVEAVIGQGKVRELYGMTETSPGVAIDQPGVRKRVGSVGLPKPSTQVRVVDPLEGCVDVPMGQEGEILVRGPQVMQGYYNKPEENARVFVEIDGERWLRTGDIGRMDEDGFLYIVDRLKDMIIVSGFKVFSTELENVLAEHPAIEMCAAVGAPNPDRPETELVKLVVQKSRTHLEEPDEQVREDILTFAREKLAPYKVPRVIEFRDMPLTVVGKIDKKQLRR